MIDVLNLQYNGSTLNGVSFEGIPVETFIANEYKYQSSIAAEDLLKILYLPDNNPLQTSYEGVLNATGNTTFVGKIHDKVKSITEITTSGNVIKAMPLDDWGYLFYRYYGHNVWPGGGCTSFPTNWGPSNFTLSYKDITTTMSFKGELNENQYTFCSGLYLNKVIRVPAASYTGTETIELFPTIFEDTFYDAEYEASITVIEWENGTIREYSYENGELISNDPNSYPSKSLEDTMFRSLSIEKSGLQLNVNYSIKGTTVNTYETIALMINGCLLHFVQEYPSSKRIYFGKEVDPLYTNDTNKSFLQTCGSFDIHVDNTDNGAIITNNTRTLEAGTHVFVPANMLAAWEGWVVNTSPEVGLVNVGTFNWGWDNLIHFEPTDISQPYTLTLS